MIQPELLEYIQQKLKEGLSKKEIRDILLLNEWQNQDIDKAFSLVDQPPSAGQEPQLPQPLQPTQGDQIDSSLDQATESDSLQSSTLSKEVSKKSKKWIIFLVLGIFVLGAAVAFGYFYYSQSPQRVFQKMTKEMAKINSVEYEGRVSATSDPNSFLIDFNGASDWKDLENPKGRFKIDIKIDPISPDFNFELITVQKKLILK